MWFVGHYILEPFWIVFEHPWNIYGAGVKKSGAQATTEVPQTATETPPRQAVMEATLNGIKGPARLVHAAAADTQAGPPAPARQAV